MVGNLPQPYHILVVDDDESCLSGEVAIIKRLGFKVAVGRNGREAVEKVKEMARKNQRFLGILMDCNMPEMDGIEATKALRELERTKEIEKQVIIAVTARVTNEKEFCLESGMNYFVEKPLSKSKLLPLLSEIMGIKK